LISAALAANAGAGINEYAAAIISMTASTAGNFRFMDAFLLCALMLLKKSI
jgi:hypothetical protein